MGQVVVSGSFDDLRSHHIRFLEEAAKLWQVHVLLWSDETTTALTGQSPKFPLEERLYILQAIRYVDQISTARVSSEYEIIDQVDELRPQAWVRSEANTNARLKPSANLVVCRSNLGHIRSCRSYPFNLLLS